MARPVLGDDPRHRDAQQSGGGDDARPQDGGDLGLDLARLFPADLIGDAHPVNPLYSICATMAARTTTNHDRIVAAGSFGSIRVPTAAPATTPRAMGATSASSTWPRSR